MTQSEVDHFSAQACQWWDAKGPMKTLHALNPCRLAYIEHIAAPLTHAPLRCLDVGCGGGLLSEAMAQSTTLKRQDQPAQVTGIDPSSPLIQIASLHAQSQGLSIHYQCTDLEKLHRGNTYDLITVMELLEHLENPSEWVRRCAEHLAPGGRMIFSTVNRSLSAFMGAIVLAEHVFNWVPKGTHRYEQFIRPSELAHWVEDAGLRVLGTKGLQYNPWTHRAELVPHHPINYLLSAEKVKTDF